MTRQRAVIIGALVFVIVVLVTVFLGYHSEGSTDNGNTGAMSADEERKTLGKTGVPLLAGPLDTGGPTYGESARADLEVTDFFWTRNASGQRAFYVEVKNKSSRIWSDVTAQIEIFYPDQTTDRVSISLGTLKPGIKRGDITPAIGGEHPISRLLGITGK